MAFAGIFPFWINPPGVPYSKSTAEEIGSIFPAVLPSPLSFWVVMKLSCSVWRKLGSSSGSPPRSSLPARVAKDTEIDTDCTLEVSSKITLVHLVGNLLLTVMKWNCPNYLSIFRPTPTFPSSSSFILWDLKIATSSVCYGRSPPNLGVDSFLGNSAFAPRGVVILSENWDPDSSTETMGRS